MGASSKYLSGSAADGVVLSLSCVARLRPGIRSTTAHCGCLLRGQHGDTAGLANRERAADRGAPGADGAWAGTRTPTPNSSAPHTPISHKTYRRVSLPVLWCAVVGVSARAITSRSWW